MQLKEVQLKKQEVITDVLCDSCGRSCKVYESTTDNPKRIDDGEKFYSFEYLKLEANWGYDSNKDLERWTAQICENCVDEKLSFIKFKKTNLTFGTVIQEEK
jgi:alanine dehydrogenase